MEFFNKFNRNYRSFVIASNRFLKQEIMGLTYCNYTKGNKKENPNFLLVFKNTFKDQNINNIRRASCILYRMLDDVFSVDFGKISYPKECNKNNLVMVCVPRSRKEDNLVDEQKYFRKTVALFVKSHPLIGDATSAIIRVKNTATTHLSRTEYATDGDMPYPGITKNTCNIDESQINGKTVILVDDIYTKSINIVEDCAQALFDCGAHKVIVFTIATTNLNSL